ncbi:hypothetical protein EV421DRAFT_1911133 [Armillaria borealis]|uniref:Uncharacterized protein n=1 Tax=Armillaria borealis TaxID=47425 RepID=A0AA39IXD4_9AGAR|nr:hypothetical protein EV421DRAFT_1911133 [Armillaria borealis]
MFFRILALLPFVSLAILNSPVDSADFDDFCADLDTLTVKVKQMEMDCATFQQTPNEQVLFSDSKKVDSEIKDATNTCPITILSEAQGQVVLSKVSDLKSPLLNVCNCVIASQEDFNKLGVTAEVGIVVKEVNADGNDLMNKVLGCTPDGSQAGMEAEHEDIVAALQKLDETYNAN